MAANALALLAYLSAPCAADGRTVGVAPLSSGPFPVACSDVAYDVSRVGQIGGTPADFWEGNPQNGQPRYFTDVLLEPQDTIRIDPVVPNDSNFYVQTWNRPVPYVVIVCYPTSRSNFRPDYPLTDSLVVPKMQRAGQSPIFPELIIAPIAIGQEDPNLLPLLVFSHGLSGSPLDDNSREVIFRLASFGYVVAAPFHGDPRFSLVQANNIGELWSVLRNFDQFVEMEALRPLSLKATIDAILSHRDFGPRINPNKIGGYGVSMGGASMTWLLGASITDGFVSQNAHPAVRDPRIKAAIGYVPYAGESFLPAFGESNNTAKNVNTPYLAISGTADTVAPMYRMEQAMNLFQNSHYMVALTGVPHDYDSSYAGDVIGWAIPFLNAYVKDDAGALANFLQQKLILGGLDDNLVIDYTAPATIAFTPGWNLIGNSIEISLSVADAFSDATKVATVWKWITTGAIPDLTYPTWAFYSPALGDGGKAYAASRGYEFLSSINAGEGFWLDAKVEFTMPLPSGTPIQSSSFTPAIAATTGGAHALSKGWSLIATGDKPTPAQFAAVIATGSSTPPSDGIAQPHMTSLWAWDATRRGWYFWAPSLQNDGSLPGYLAAKAYLGFETIPTAPKGTLPTTFGIWVNVQ